MKVAAWAENYANRGVCFTTEQIHEEIQAGIAMLEYPDEYSIDIHEMAWIHAQNVHHCKILRNRGVKPPRLSLNWLRWAAREIDVELASQGVQGE